LAPQRATALPPVVTPKVDNAQITGIATTISSFQIQPSLVFPKQKTIPTSVDRAGKIVKFSYPTVMASVTHIVWSCIQSKIEEPRLSVINGLINSTISTNNTTVSSLVRQKAQLPSSEFPLRIDEEETDYLCAKLPIREIDTLITLPDFTDSAIFDIVPSSDAGMPEMAYDASAKCGNNEVYLRTIALTNKYLGMLNKPDALNPGVHGNFLVYMKQNPLEFTYIMKRKFERIKRSDFDIKCRTYFVAPYALKLLFKWVSYYVRNQSINFLDVDIDGKSLHSVSAYRFSWSNGGADKVMEWIYSHKSESRKSGLMMFDAIVFGDDQLWSFTFPDGVVVVTAPDIVGMDMHVSSKVGQIELSRHFNSFKVRPSHAYSNVCKLLAAHAFRQRVLVSGSIVVTKLFGLISGIPLTTQLDIAAAVIAQRLVTTQTKMFNVGYNSNRPNNYCGNNVKFDDFLGSEFCNPLKIKTSIFGMFPSKTGFTIKPETRGYQVFTPSSEDDHLDLDLKFLGYKVKFDKEFKHYYPVPDDLEKCWSSLALPSAPVPKGAGNDLLLSRIYGILLSGGVFNPEFAKFASELFEYVKLNGGQLKSVDVSSLTIELSDIAKLVALHPSPLTERETKLFYMFGEVDKELSQEPVSNVSDDTTSYEILSTDLSVPHQFAPPIPASKIGQKLPAPKLVRLPAEKKKSMRVVKEKRGIDRQHHNDNDLLDEEAEIDASDDIHLTPEELRIQQLEEEYMKKVAALDIDLADAEEKKFDEFGEDEYDLGDYDKLDGVTNIQHAIYHSENPTYYSSTHSSSTTFPKTIRFHT